MKTTQEQPESAGAVSSTRFLCPCRLCGKTPTLPEMWADASGNHSEKVAIACGCGVQVADKMQNRYAAKAGDTGWSMLYGEWAIATKTAADKWDALMGHNAQAGL